jgi:hypothetical protein
MARIPNSKPTGSPRCDPRLPDAALRYRVRQSLTTRDVLGAINITAWLYRDKYGVEGIKVNPNVTIAELRRVFGPASTPTQRSGSTPRAGPQSGSELGLICKCSRYLLNGFLAPACAHPC